MPRVCLVCANQARTEIDGRLVAGESFRRIAAQYSISPSAVRRHAGSHIAAALREARQLANGDSLLDRLQSLNAEAQAILAEAKASKNPHLVLKAIDRAIRLIEVQGRLAGELSEGSTVDVNVNDQAARIVACVVSNVSDAETRLRIAEALREIG